LRLWLSVFPSEGAGRPQGIAPTMPRSRVGSASIVGAIPCGRPASFVSQFHPESCRPQQPALQPLTNAIFSRTIVIAVGAYGYQPIDQCIDQDERVPLECVVAPLVGVRSVAGNPFAMPGAASVPRSSFLCSCSVNEWAATIVAPTVIVESCHLNRRILRRRNDCGNVTGDVTAR
jgi:hypothetical protein